jgi:hypothetical protein
MIHKDQAWKLALEALEIQAYNSGDEKYTEAITAINQSLALDKMAENARQLGLDYEPVAWTPGPNLFKDWCSQYFGPDADDAYLADAIFNLPPIAQRFASTPPAAAPVQEPWCMKMNGCKTKCEDCPDYVPPAAAPMQDEFPLRGILASELKCWHRLTEDEQINLLAFVKNTRPASPVQPEEPVEWGSLPAGKEKVLRKALAALRGPVADGLARRSAIHSLECEIASTPPAAPVQEPKMPEFFAELEYNSPDWDVFACVYRRRADAAPELVHREQMPRQTAPVQPIGTVYKSQSGDTCAGVIPDPTKVKDGDKLYAAAAPAAAPVQPGQNHYEDGDVFERIAAMKKPAAQPAPVTDNTATWSDELALIESVLKGYPDSIAKADALRAVRGLQATPPSPGGNLLG